MVKRKYSGRQLMLYGALLLLVWAGYEFYVRLDTLKWWFDGITRLCAAEGIPFTRAVGYFDMAMFNLTLYLLALTVFSIVCVALRNRPKWDYIVLALTVGIGVAGGLWVNLFSLSILNWAQSLKLMPLLLIAAGCVVNIAQFHIRNRRGDRPEPDDADGRDYTQMSRRELARQVKRHRSHRNGDAA